MTTWTRLPGPIAFWTPVTLRHYKEGEEHFVLFFVPESEWDRLIKSGWQFNHQPGGHFTTYSNLLAETEAIYFGIIIQEAGK